MGKESFKVAVATDLHYLSSELWDNGESFDLINRYSDGALRMYGDEIYEAFLAEIKELNPDALLITGDLTFNGEKKSHEYLSRGFESLWKMGIPVLIIPGNHDISNPMAGIYIGSEAKLTETVSKDEFCRIYAAPVTDRRNFILPDESSLSFVYTLSDDLWLMCLDVNANSLPGVLTEGNLLWVKKVLQKAANVNARVISVTHQNILPHNELIFAGFVIEGAERLVTLYNDAGIHLNLSGHMHIQHIKEEGSLTEIVTSALMIPPCQYGILDIKGDKAEYHSKIIDVASWAQRAGSDNPDLLNFPDFASAFYMDVQRREMDSELYDTSLSPSAKEKLATAMGCINQAYFAGTLSDLEGRDKMRAIWQEQLPGNFRNDYIASIFDERVKDERNAAILL